MQWVSIEGTASTIDDEEEDDARESAAETLVSQNDSEGQSEGENEYTTSFRAENCTFSSTGRNPFFILESNYQLALSEKMAAMLLN